MNEYGLMGVCVYIYIYIYIYIMSKWLGLSSLKSSWSVVYIFHFLSVMCYVCQSAKIRYLVMIKYDIVFNEKISINFQIRSRNLIKINDTYTLLLKYFKLCFRDICTSGFCLINCDLQGQGHDCFENVYTSFLSKNNQLRFQVCIQVHVCSICVT